ncbi:MAG: glycosyltransferase [Pseudomonadota bacterium]
MIRLFCGYDAREAVGFHTFAHSVISRASQPVSIVPMAGMGLPPGTNTFTLSRFLVPFMMGFQGHAIFADACDMLMLGDVAELDALFDPSKAVQVVQHQNYVSQHARKYVGTEMECEQSNYARKNWASLMLINCGHEAWRERYTCLGHEPTIKHLQFDGFTSQEMGALPPEWNVLIDEGQDDAGAKVLHWTAGLPTFKHYQNARRSADWFNEYTAMTGASHRA